MTTTEALDLLEQQVDDELMKLTLEETRELAESIRLEEKYYKDSSLLNTRRGIRKHLESEDEADLEARKTVLVRCETIIKALLQNRGNKLPNIEDVKADINKDIKPTVFNVTEDFTHFLRKECKLNGQIGNPDQKDKLSYVGLMRQINENVEKGYPESEITSSVIRAMVPGLQLRAYLECMPVVPLNRLRKILRSHYREKSATELYQELTCMTQRKNEDALAFLLRAFELREKVSLASQEEGALKYDNVLVQGLTVHTIETGLSEENNNIRTQIRPYLQTKDISDVELMTQMRIIIAAEENRRNKQSKLLVEEKIAKAGVKAVNCDGSPEGSNMNLLLGKLTNIESQMSELKTVQSDINQLRAEVNVLKQGTSSRGPSRRTFTCEQCQSTNNRNCTHCFKCGGNNHFAKDCFKNNNTNRFNNNRWNQDGRQTQQQQMGAGNRGDLSGQGRW